MAVTINGTSGLTFNDATTQSTAAVVNTTSVLNATAGASAGAVGTYAFLAQSAFTTTTIIAGTTYAGSGLRYGAVYVAGNTATIEVDNTGATPSGTWRAVGSSTPTGATAGNLRITSFLRIA